MEISIKSVNQKQLFIQLGYINLTDRTSNLIKPFDNELIILSPHFYFYIGGEKSRIPVPLISRVVGNIFDINRNIIDTNRKRTWLVRKVFAMVQKSSFFFRKVFAMVLKKLYRAQKKDALFQKSFCHVAEVFVLFQKSFCRGAEKSVSSIEKRRSFSEKFLTRL